MDVYLDDDQQRAWVPRSLNPTVGPKNAIFAVAEELDVAPGRLRATEVLVREESEVEARINGHECPYLVECTARARQPQPFWRIELGPAVGLRVL